VRLKCIKLAGFKSFVDPTTVNFPSNMAAVVGPNGCGKSNIIDAVRWVLGESKASELRGESMQDVIFNGSTNRKPAGRSSVELVFDNGDGKAAGHGASMRKSPSSARSRVTARLPITSIINRSAGATFRIFSWVPSWPACLRHHRSGHDFAHH